MASTLTIRVWRSVLALAVLVLGLPLMATAQDPIHWSISHTDRDVIHAGRTFAVELDANIDPAWHLYALNQPPGGPVPLVIGVAAGRTFKMAGEIGSGLPKMVVDPNFNLETLFYEDRASFTVPIDVDPSTRDGLYRLGVTVAYQTCNDRLCLPPKGELILNRTGFSRGRSRVYSEAWNRFFGDA